MRLAAGDTIGDRSIVYVPEGMRPRILDVEGVGGTIEPAPAQPKWIVYGDSIAEGWCASAPALAWPAAAAREQGLDVYNLGYAGAARGEIVSAEHIAGLEADVIAVTHGTNCWTRTPFSVALFRAGLEAFLDVVRQGHPDTPVLVVSPVLRPEGESTRNKLGATLADLRKTMEDVTRERMASDTHMALVEGLPLIDETMLLDPTHPNDKGHRALATAIGPRVRALLDEGAA